ncbi:SIR2-like domain protein [Leptospira santarosai str. ST188]|nr:SIR2-like domain protein [Leptospira santarosai str. ST188]
MLFLFGAGASADAGIPISNEMVLKIEELILHDWHKYKDLYFYLKSSINYSDGILGRFNVPFNVERLLIVITEIEKRESNIMYPFIGTWNIRLLDLAGQNFENIRELHKLIRQQLIEWVALKNYDRANYYESFIFLSRDIGQIMKVFTLNYDLCFETIVGKDVTVELGFTKNNNEWHYSNFDDVNGKSYNLYKLHGSIDWYNDDNKLLKSSKPENSPELIFGIQHKMTSVDPYFYYSSILRATCFNEANLIIAIGYSFADEYVNVILSQALNYRTNLRIIVVSPFGTMSEDDILSNLMKFLNTKNKNQVIPLNFTAKDFMTNVMNMEFLKSKFIEPDNVPF